MSKRLPQDGAKYHKGYPKTSTSGQSDGATRLQGSTWVDEKGRTWEVIGLVPPGRVKVGVRVRPQQGGQGWIYNYLGTMTASEARKRAAG